MTDSTQKPKNSKSVLTTIEDADLLKFQLLSAYIGLRTQDVEALEKDLELFAVKKELAEVAREKAIRELLHYQEWLKKEYCLQPNHLVNYSDGTIQRDRQPIHENQKAKTPVDNRKEEKEKEKEVSLATEE